jgi:lipase chaperone LimK
LTRAWVVGAGGALALCAWWAGAGHVASPLTATSAAPAVPVATPAAPHAEAPTAESLPAPMQAARVLPASLQDTEADGSWRADARGNLVVDRAVRRRFDYWLSTVGELTPEAIGTQVLAAARRELPSAAAGQLQTLWSHYVDLQRHAWQRAAQPGDPATWRAALEERQSVRRQLLGRDAAEAFYADEEQALWADILAWESGKARPVAEVPTVPEHPQAAQRVAEVQAQWAQWDRRVDEARGEVARLRGARELSDPQREQAVQAWLAQRFNGSEQMRVRALLGLSPAPGA